MRQFLPNILIVFLITSQSSVQEPTIHHSTRPQYQDHQNVIEITETHAYGVSEPADSPEAWWSVSDISPGPDNGILVSDSRQHRVDLVIPGKGVTTSFGYGEGAGPGELSQPWSSAYDRGEFIYISENGNTRISVFRSNGEFIQIIRTIHRPARVVVGDQQDLWVGRYWGINVDGVDRYDSESGQFVLSVGDRYRNEEWYGQWTIEPLLAYSQSRVLVSTRHSPELVEYNSDGIITRIISRDIEWLTPPEPVPDLPERIWNLSNGHVSQLGVMPDGTIVSLLARIQRYRDEQSTTKEYYLDFFSSEGLWLTTVPLKSFGRDMYLYTMTIALDGGLWLCYINENDIPTIVRYEITWILLN